ncbi:MAG: guanylate kinase [bacterium]|nr:guanylate kinase [bacterium]
MKKGVFFVVSGPSGVGKGTVLKKVMAANPNLHYSVSATTRAPREGEIDGVNYFFMSEDEFDRKVENGEFLEHVKTYGISYGTLKKNVEDKVDSGQCVILEIDVKGALNLMDRGIRAVYIFIAPEKFSVIRERLLNRGTEDPEMLEKRVEVAKWELEQADKYEYVIINKDLDKACCEFDSIVRASSCLASCTDFSEFDWSGRKRSAE